MEMKWVVIVKKHLDDDSEKAADFRHKWARSARRERLLPDFFPSL